MLTALYFATLFAALLTGIPVVIALLAHSLGFAMLLAALGNFDLFLLQAIPLRIFGVVHNELLLAILFFTAIGAFLEKSGIAFDLLRAAGRVFARVPGGMAIAVVLIGALLAATTGVLSATVIAMGLVSLPAMLAAGYHPRLATGVVAASGTLTQVIPPSIVLVVMAEVLGISLGELYQAALVPGLLLTGAYCAYVGLAARLRPGLAPPLRHAPAIGRGELWALFLAIVPAKILILAIFGSMWFGLATPTEAGSMGLLATLILAAARRRLDFGMALEAMRTTVVLSTAIMFILIATTGFGLVLRGFDGDLEVARLLARLPGGVIGFLVFANLIVFVLAFVLDFFEIAFLLLPLLTAAAHALGIDLVAFAVMLAVNLQTSFIHPPFGYALFNLRAVAPAEVRTGDIYWGAVPFIVVQMVAVAVLTLRVAASAPG